MNNFPRTPARRLLIALLTLAPMLASAQDKQIEKLIEAGKFAEAKPVIEQRLEDTPGDSYLQYNLALTHYAEGNYEDAIVLWEKVRLSPDEELVTKAMAQIGNASYRISLQVGKEGRKDDETIQLRRALHSLQAAVERDDDYDVAQKNHQYVADKMVEHLIQQGNSKVERTEVRWIKGDRDLVLFRSALTDYEEALSIKPEDEEIQKLVDETRKKMTDFLTRRAEKNLEEAEKKLDKVKEPTVDEKLQREDGNNLRDAERAVSEAMANYDDALSVSPDDEATQEAAKKAREKASQLMQEAADKWRKNSEDYEKRIAEKQQRRKEVAEQRENEENKEKRKELYEELKDLSKSIHHAQHYQQEHVDNAIEDYERALDYNPDNEQALAAKQELQSKMSEKIEAAADEHLEVAERAQQNIENRQESLEKVTEALETAEGKKADELEYRKNKIEQQNASSAQHAANELLDAKNELEKATQLDPGNESAEQKLAQTSEKIADALEQAADLQLAAAEQLEQEGKGDQAIARKEMAIKNFDSAMALSQDEQQQQALGQKMEAARQQLLAQRNERAQQLAAQQKQQQMQAAQQQAQAAAQQQPQNPQQSAEGQKQEEAAQYMEMVQFAEEGASEEFGKFDTKAMKQVVKDW